MKLCDLGLAKDLASSANLTAGGMLLGSPYYISPEYATTGSLDSRSDIYGLGVTLFHCACGDVFRALDTRTELGRRFVEYSSRGELVPDELTVELWKDRIDRSADAGTYKPDLDILVLDGIPRNANQAAMLDAYIEVAHVFHLSCPDREELVRRMRKRALKDNRLDDAKDEVIRQRFVTYEAETKPILEFYDPSKLCELDAAQPPVKVFYDMLERILTLEVYKQRARIVA